MKKILFWLLALPLVAGFVACDNDDNTDTYEEWRQTNLDYINKQAALEENGRAYYQRVSPAWNPSIYVLIHYFNDRNITAGNLQPLETSTVAVKYKGMFYNGIGFDSSYVNTDSLYTTTLTSVISGWQVALQQMHVGDSVEVIIPYQAGYGIIGSGSIPPYSTLRFGIKLVDIPYYEVRP